VHCFPGLLSTCCSEADFKANCQRLVGWRWKCGRCHFSSGSRIGSRGGGLSILASCVGHSEHELIRICCDSCQCSRSCRSASVIGFALSGFVRGTHVCCLQSRRGISSLSKGADWSRFTGPSLWARASRGNKEAHLHRTSLCRRGNTWRGPRPALYSPWIWTALVRVRPEPFIQYPAATGNLKD